MALDKSIMKFCNKSKQLLQLCRTEHEQLSYLTEQVNIYDLNVIQPSKICNFSLQ